MSETFPSQNFVRTVEGRYDPDRLLSAVVEDGMSGDEVACYMILSSLVLSHGGPIPRHEAIDYLETVFRWRPQQLDVIVARLRSLGRLTMESGQIDARLPPYTPPPLEKKKNGFALDLFAANLPPPPEPIPIPRKPPAAASLPLTAQARCDALRPEFDIWYRGYPIKRAPDAALRAYVKAREKTSFDELIAGRDRYAASVKGEDPHHIKHPATWLNAGCWKDEIEATPEDRAWF